MPIHDQGYRRYGGRKEPRGRTWWVIARAGLIERLRERKFLALLLFAWLPFLFRAVQIYISANFSQASFLAPSAETFREYLDQQSIFVFFVTIYVGSGLIANDRRANALQIYLSKPLTRVEYITGKMMTLLIFLLAVTWLPAMLLLIVQMMFAGSTTFVAQNLFLVPAITVVCAIEVFVSAVAVLALSSLSKSRRFVAIMYAGVLFFTAAMYQALRAMTGSGVWALFSPGDTIGIIADRIFRVPAPGASPLWAAVIAVAMLIAVSIWTLERRVRAVEVVA